MNIAYLMNSYPMTSTTFIRREIEALESIGLRIHRHAVRTSAGKLVDPRDIAEKEQTHYLLAGNVLGLIAASIREVFCNPRGLMRASGIWIKLSFGLCVIQSTHCSWQVFQEPKKLV